MKRVGDDLPGFLEVIGIRDEKNYGGFVSAWKELIGEELSWHSRPVDIKGTLLLVAVDHPGWMTRIRFAENSLLTRLHQRFPQLGITSLAFSLVKELPSRARAVETQVPQQEATEKANSSPNTSDAEKAGSAPDETVPDPEKPAELFAALGRLRDAIRKKKPNDS